MRPRQPGQASVSLNVAVCAQCHPNGRYDTRVEQWKQSSHFKGFRELSQEEAPLAARARCHAPDGFVDMAKRVAGGRDIGTASRTNNYATGRGELICQGCHDPHHTFDNPERHQLRIYGEVVIGNPAAAGHLVLSNPIWPPTTTPRAPTTLTTTPPARLSAPTTNATV